MNDFLIVFSLITLGFLLGAGFVIYVMAYHQSIEVEQRGVYVSDE
jgi:hypothetical protein